MKETTAILFSDARSSSPEFEPFFKSGSTSIFPLHPFFPEPLHKYQQVIFFFLGLDRTNLFSFDHQFQEDQKTLGDKESSLYAFSSNNAFVQRVVAKRILSNTVLSYS